MNAVERLVRLTLVCAIATTLACGGGISYPTPDRVETIEPSRLAEYLDGDRLRTGALETWFTHEDGPVYRIEVPGPESLAWWRAFRQHVETTGYWPIVIGAPDQVAMVEEVRQFQGDEPVHEPATFDLAGWRAERTATYAEYGEEPRGSWPGRGEATPADFTVDVDILTGESLQTVVLALLPTRSGWKAPRILGYGGWNECPSPHVHAATLRDWESRFGAELVTLSGAVVELAVTRPPTSREDALALAREHYLYCGDIVWQGTGSLETLAASLLDAPVWFFWWD